MEEVYNFTLNKKIYDLICRRIKLKSQLMELLIEINSLILVNIPIHDEKFGKCFIKTGNTRRIFFSVQDASSKVYKHFSFHFPFRLYKENERFKLETLNGGVVIESYHLAVLRAICSNGGFNEKECRHGLLLDFSQLVESTFLDLNMQMDFYENELSQLLMELFLFEPSYIRYDYDQKNEDGRLHPLNHLDIFYTQHTTFKLGSTQLELNEFMDILDTETDCEYLDGAHSSLSTSTV